MRLPHALLPVLFAFVLTDVPAAPPDMSKPDRMQFRRLLNDTPPQFMIDEYVRLLKHPETAKHKDDLDNARQQISKVKTNVPKIRALLKPGLSVFDYPGLLAHGRIAYDAERGCKFYLGISRGSEGISRYDFQMWFDEKGVITDVRDVDWLQ